MKSLGVCLGLALLALTAFADEAPALRLSGFGTLGLTRTNTDNAGFVRDLYQPEGTGRHWSMRTDSVLGVQANYLISDRFEAVVQATSRYHAGRSISPEISWAFVKFSPSPVVDLRFGRIGTDFFMLSDSRLIGYSYLAVRPSADFFLPLPFYSINGGDATFVMPAGEGVLRLKAFVGDSHERLGLGQEIWKLAGSRMSGAYAEYQWGAWQVRGSYANIRFKGRLPIREVMTADLVADSVNPDAAFALASAVDSRLAINGTRTDYWSLGLVYDDGPWQAQLMLNKIDQGSLAFENGLGGAAQVGYRVGEFTPYMGYSFARSQRRASIDTITDAAMAFTHVNQQTYTLGVRWDVASNTAIKLQGDMIRGDSSSIFPFRSETTAWNGKMNVLTTTLDFIF